MNGEPLPNTTESIFICQLLPVGVCGELQSAAATPSLPPKCTQTKGTVGERTGSAAAVNDGASSRLLVRSVTNRRCVRELVSSLRRASLTTTNGKSLSGTSS